MTPSDPTPVDPAYPLLTIAIPTFNRAALLKGCIESALSQTYPHLEVVVSNNASSDNTRSVLSEFKDVRLRVINQDTNIGMHPNWNACLANAKGDYVVFLSDDDRVAPWFLEQCARLIREHPGLPAVVTLSNIHAASLNRTKPARASRLHHTGVWEGIEILSDFLTDEITVTVCSVMMQTDLLRERGGLPFDMPHTADVAAWAPLLLLGKTGLVNEACATFTYHARSATAQMSIEQILADGRKVVDLIARSADIRVTDPQRRRTIQVQAQRCFARRGLIALSDYRRSGGGLREILNVMWRFRGDLYGASLQAILRFITVVFGPKALVEHVRQMRHSIPERLA